MQHWIHAADATAQSLRAYASARDFQFQMEGLTPDSGLRILSPCEFTRFGAAVVVLSRRAWVTESSGTHSARCGLVLYLDFAQSHPKTAVALVP